MAGAKSAKKRSQAWKSLEREAADLVGGTRRSRGDNFAVSADDVSVPDMPFLKIDAKYRKSHSHHSLMEEIRKKYCKEDGDVPVMVSKHHRQRGCYVTIPGDFFQKLIKIYRDVNCDPDVHPLARVPSRAVPPPAVNPGAAARVACTECGFGTDDEDYRDGSVWVCRTHRLCSFCDSDECCRTDGCYGQICLECDYCHICNDNSSPNPYNHTCQCSCAQCLELAA